MKRLSVTVILAAILATAAAIAHAQHASLSSQLTPGRIFDNSAVITGQDLGFRVERMDGNRPVGQLVIRQNGPAGATVWTPVELGGSGVTQLTLK